MSVCLFVMHSDPVIASATNTFHSSPLSPGEDRKRFSTTGGVELRERICMKTIQLMINYNLNLIFGDSEDLETIHLILPLFRAECECGR